MTIAFALWLLPVIATVLVWVGLVLCPVPPSRGDYDFGPGFVALALLVAAVVATLIIWLTWFDFLALGGAS